MRRIPFPKPYFVAEKENAKIDINNPGFWNQIGVQFAVEAKPDVVGSRRIRKPKSYAEDFYRESRRSKRKHKDDDFALAEVDLVSSDAEQAQEIRSIEDAIMTHVWGRWKQIAEVVTRAQKKRLVTISPQEKGKHREY